MVGSESIGREIAADPTGTFITTAHRSWRLVDYGPDIGMVSEDPGFGAYLIKPGVIADLIRTPAFDRSLDIGQLSRLKKEGAIPNIALVNTAGCNVAQLPLINYLSDRMQASEEERTAYIIAQSITDVSHGQLRHMTDMEIEGLSGDQVFHEQRKMQTFELGGITEVLDSHGITLGKDGLVPGIEIPPCIESKIPHVNADNYQYVMAETYESFAGYENHPDEEVRKNAAEIIAKVKRMGNFKEVIDVDPDGQIWFKHPEDALFFQKCQMLASTEDWKDLVGRVLEHQYVQDLKYSKVDRLLPGMDEIDNGTTLHPHDYTYYVDTDIEDMQSSPENFRNPNVYASRNLKKHISQEERERHYNSKIKRYAQFLTDDKAEDYPNEMINGNVVSYGLPSSRVEILDQKEVDKDSPTTNTAARLAPDSMQSEEGVTFILDPFKNRVVRPFVKNHRGERVYLDQLKSPNGEPSPLAEASRKLYDQHQRLQWQQLTARLVITRNYAKNMREMFKQTNEGYDQLLGRDRMSRDQIRRSIGAAGLRARTTALESGLLVVKY